MARRREAPVTSHPRLAEPTRSAVFIQAEMPITRLVSWSEVTFAHRRVRGLSTPFRATPDTYMGELWLEDGGGQ